MKRSKWTDDLHWVRTSQQSRSERTQTKLLDAAERLFGERGVSDTSVADIAEHAGCSVGAVYHHFSDKKAILYSLFDRIIDEYQATAALALEPGRWQGASVGDIVLAYLEISLVSVDHRLGSGLPGLEIARAEPELRSQFETALTRTDAGIANLLLERRDQIGHPDPPLAIKFVLEQLGAMLRARLSGDSLDSRFGDVDDSGFVAEAVTSVCAYLQTPLPASNGR